MSNGLQTLLYLDQQEFVDQLGLTFLAVLTQLPTLAYRNVKQ